LLVRSELSISENANCSVLDNTKILHVTSSKKKKVENFQDILCVEEEYNINDDDDQHNEIEEINVYKEDVIEHISGFVIKQLKRTVYCPTCCNALEDTTKNRTLIDIKNRRLIKPSIDVIKICKLI